MFHDILRYVFMTGFYEPVCIFRIAEIIGPRNQLNAYVDVSKYENVNDYKGGYIRSICNLLECFNG